MTWEEAVTHTCGHMHAGGDALPSRGQTKFYHYPDLMLTGSLMEREDDVTSLESMSK